MPSRQLLVSQVFPQVDQGCI